MKASPNDPGSPWAIGTKEGGHQSIHASLGTLNDFQNVIKAAKKLNLEIALDYALQCSPDHPYLKSHPEWFKQRSDGSLQYAENPPKKYQDIYPFNFESEKWESLWKELKSIFIFWISQGVKIFRVDNPHTKPFAFWEWAIKEVKKEYPAVIFLAEAFTRPKIMYHLAKVGFTESYTYFTWKNNKKELTEYFSELNSYPTREFFRPNIWCNTPDILHDFLQKGGKNAFVIRLILAATLGGNYGIYGPLFELCINAPLNENSEEYLNSEKYEIKKWNMKQEPPLFSIIKKINEIRNSNRALQNFNSLLFHPIDNDQMICYSKNDFETKNIIITIVNLDYQYRQSGWVTLDLNALGFNEPTYLAMDVLNDQEYIWKIGKNFVELNPATTAAHIFSIKAIGNHNATN